jgi:hypothetical protein
MGSLLNESIIPLAKAANKFPSGERGCVNPCTLWRWATKGCRASDGAVVRLQFIKAGHRVYTSTEAVERFVTALTQASLPPEAKDAPRTPAQTRAAAVAADAELEAAGA